jgi:hypothetical protein
MTATLVLPGDAPEADWLEARRQGVCQIPEEEYFAATYALSASGAKDILDCPARFRYKQAHPTLKKEFDYGSAAHKVVLGSGPDIEVIDAACLARLADTTADAKTARLYADTAGKGDPAAWATSAAKAARDNARAAGKIPLLRRDHDHVRAMADEIRRHPLASALFDPSAGLPEQSLFWHDSESGIDRRARLDWLPDPRGARLIIGDYKTCADASPGAIRRAVGDWAYHIQRSWYCAAVRACGIDDDPGFVYIFQEKDPPYLINPVQLDPAAIASGDIASQAACEIFRDCTGAGVWPGYPYEPDITAVSLPPWKSRIPEEYYQ